MIPQRDVDGYWLRKTAERVTTLVLEHESENIAEVVNDVYEVIALDTSPCTELCRHSTSCEEGYKARLAERRRREGDTVNGN